MTSGEESSVADPPDASGWSEDTSRHFIDYGAYFVPERETQIDTICSVVPPAPEGALMVEICCGEGLLCEALARRFPGAEIHALDGSETMLAAAKTRLEAAGATHRTALIDIAETGWRTFERPVHAFVSSLAVHHLDGPAKARLFRDLAAALAPGGVVVICDLVEARREAGLALWKRHWDDGVRERSRSSSTATRRCSSSSARTGGTTTRIPTATPPTCRPRSSTSCSGWRRPACPRSTSTGCVPATPSSPVMKP